MREPPSSLRRAQVLWFHRKSEREAKPDPSVVAACRRHAPEAVVVQSVAVVRTVRSLHGTLPSLAGLAVVAAAGIAHPEEFASTVQGLGVDLRALVPFADHQHYGDAEYRRLKREAEKHGAQAVLITAKDAVKWLPKPAVSIPVGVVDIDVSIRSGGARLADLLQVDPHLLEDEDEAGVGPARYRASLPPLGVQTF